MPTLKHVKKRYSKAAKKKEAALCCPVNYNSEYLKIIPEEVLLKDYGCGDPSRYVQKGDIVLDLGSGGGKICFIAAQIVGKTGKVLGVDANDDMLDLAKRNQKIIEKKLGFKNIEFKHGYIQDLKTDLDMLEKYLQDNHLTSAQDFKTLQEYIEVIKKKKTLIADDSVDIVVSNCVLNLVSDDLKDQLFKEIFRVLKPGGSIAISDIVSDEPSPPHLKKDATLWSGCISGALQEHQFIKMLEDVGFYGISIDKYEEDPWQIVEGIEYRSMTITAHKGKRSPCYDGHQAVIYKGPWKNVTDDDGHTLHRGERTAVCEKTFSMFTKQPYKETVIAIPPHKSVKMKIAFNCSTPTIRDPKETKQGKKKTTTQQSCC